MIPLRRTHRLLSRRTHSMSAVYMHGAKDVRMGDKVRPETIPEGSVLLDVVAVGICGSDLHYYKDGGIGSAVITEPFVPGRRETRSFRHTLTP